ncbi:ZIP family metal transporter [Roseateles aquatilis]|nr:ZIP family metal transporter [Roseateles aquatilis]
MLIGMILAACLLSSVLSLAIAAALTHRLSSGMRERLVAFAAGVMLAAALLDLLPEALASTSEPQQILGSVLAGLLLFHLIERWSRDRRARAQAPVAAAPPASDSLRGAPWTVLIGDGLHNFVDGVLIAGAFLVHPWLGLTTAVAVTLHEIPQELGDFVVLSAAGWPRREAVLGNALSGLTSVLGGLVGWLALDGMQGLLPHALALAAASLIYIAVADLMPWLHQRDGRGGAAPHALAMSAGVVALPMAAHWLH